MEEVARSAEAGQLSVEDVGLLAETLAGAPDSRIPTDKRSPVCDFSSTGGAGSLSTLLGPYLLRSRGARVRSLAVPGSVAGGIDAIAAIPGYTVNSGVEDAARVLDRCGIVRMQAGSGGAGALAELDAEFFRYRKRSNFVGVRDLAIASLLAKKLAAGITHFVLDVRFGMNGNFGPDRVQAEANSLRFAAVAERLGLQCVCALNDSDILAQPFVGRREALVALDLVMSGDYHRLRGHVEGVEGAVGKLLEYFPTLPALPPIPFKQVVSENLEAQGASPEAFRALLSQHGLFPKQVFRAKSGGYLQVDLVELKRLLTERVTDSGETVGVEFLSLPGERVEASAPVALFTSEKLGAALDTQHFGEAIKISETVSPIPATTAIAYVSTFNATPEVK